MKLSDRPVRRSMSEEVSLDAAITEKLQLQGDTTEDRLDALLAKVVAGLQARDGLPAEVLLVSHLHSETELSLCPDTVVPSLRYLLTNLEMVLTGEAELAADTAEDITACAMDLASSYWRIHSRTGTGNITDTLERLQNTTLTEEDPSELLQHQSDISYCHAALNDVPMFRRSITSEISLLLQLGNIQKAVSKVRRHKLFVHGLSSLSELLSSEDVSRFEEVCKARKNLFADYLNFMDEEDALDSDAESDKYAANIIVDKTADRGYRDAKFYVNDLQSALKLVQNKGGIIFLESGDYSTETFFDIKQKNPETSVQIIGANTSSCSIHGTLKIQADNKVVFKRLKFEVGESPECKDAIYLTSGAAVFRECLLEATVNTLFYVLAGASLGLEHCVVDGLESCQRCVSVTGDTCHVDIVTCWLRDMFSVLTVTPGDSVTRLALLLKGCEVEGVQTVVTCHEVTCDRVTLEANTCHLVLYSEEDSSHVLSLNGKDWRHDGNTEHNHVVAQNNLLYFHHIDGKGFHVAHVPSVRIFRCQMVTEEAIDRKLAICEAVTTFNVLRLALDRVKVTGFRLGLSLAATPEVSVTKCSLEQCSVGVQVAASCSGRLDIADTDIRTTYYGLLVLSPDTAVSLKEARFEDVPKPLLLSPGAAASLSEERCSYSLSRDFTSSAEFSVLEAEMNLHLATSENIAHRTAYSRDEVDLVFRYGHLGYTQP